ncbi:MULTISPECIES: YggS family pyridoxal phosphate-dependent enzyme [unclassified Brenneria]|uniref:YggS family pyridoxal phosphate-dependent enzyme n=1 Tax=unclassified Brenneria TaxID=2634434 RepID=UPI00155520D2|nr:MULTISPECIES: YggS family pyridoxal phosphate-dependent enzyme [unclassified Brenneria]MBJ7223719.1 YggS family pyridoxal phosphate-dependent enzyme [Brenneria sp. L3-3C-1]MEE3644961.1 YggS family pyridoxal phosphate-dependent enzyme [Brenneria sp. L3_3C_1]MEE3652289.1 YggS family pyridoxal phosphate-dependent enzyme [Brenneria sp. HEZEL_4_2_4]NPD02246.1 YggS family pyridoxal phosphate-dependent enzyme [Brenneria sp. hezel4-2-4]
MTTIQQNLQHIRQQISAAAEQCARAPEAVKLLAVSKTKPVTAIEEAINAGQRAFGENYVQEGVDKIRHFRENQPDTSLEWHFIGPLQSNKSRLVAENFDWFHTVDRLRIAQRLSEQRPAALPPLNVLLQINISNEPSKSGIRVDELSALAAGVAALPNLRLRGLMAIPAPETDYQRQLAVFRRMDDLFQQLALHYPDIDTLSMGMTDDMCAAIAAGSTLVRIGTAIFGARDYAATTA